MLSDGGNLYGTTVDGGAKNYGIVYKLSPGANAQWTEEVLYSFQGGADGANPQAGLVLDAAGNIYGNTEFGGGELNDGTVFELAAPVGNGSSYGEKVLWRFNGTDGAEPVDTLVLEGAGRLYGTTGWGGSYRQGVAFEVSGLPAATATSFISSQNPSIYGQKVTFTATVTTSGSLPPTGKVAFTWRYFSETYTVGYAKLDSSGVATLTKSNLNADAYPLTAVYSGDTNHLSSASPVVNQLVLQTTSAATIMSSLNPSTLGQAVTFSAQIASPTVMPTGPVTFTAGKTVLGTAQLSGGEATFTTSSLPTGSTVVKATYNGDSNIKSSSASVTQVVRP